MKAETLSYLIIWNVAKNPGLRYLCVSDWTKLIEELEFKSKCTTCESNAESSSKAISETDAYETASASFNEDIQL